MYISVVITFICYPIKCKQCTDLRANAFIWKFAITTSHSDLNTAYMGLIIAMGLIIDLQIFEVIYFVQKSWFCDSYELLQFVVL